MLEIIWRIVTRILPREPERVARALTGRRAILTVDDAPDRGLVGARIAAIIQEIDPAYTPDAPSDERRSVAGRATLRLESDTLGAATVIVLPRHVGYGFAALCRVPIAVYVARGAPGSVGTAHADVIAIATLRLG